MPSDTWAFILPMPPKGKGRHRTRVIRPRDGGAAFARQYPDPKTESFEAQVATVAATAMPAEPIEGPLRVQVVFVLPRPKRLDGKRCHPGRHWHAARPDADNLEKAVLDGMKSRWRDDAQVCWSSPYKVIAARSEAPHVEVLVRRLGTDDAECDHVTRIVSDEVARMVTEREVGR